MRALNSFFVKPFVHFFFGRGFISLKGYISRLILRFLGEYDLLLFRVEGV